jgi:hypothetical protein
MVQKIGSTILGAALLYASAFAGPAGLWDTSSDTWAATDALGRSLPGSEEVGPSRPGKTVGIFYFLWLGQHGDLGPFDISKILAADAGAINDPKSAAWGPLGVPHHWGESIFGYYIADDESVLRKHAQMLTDAGIDAVIFDVTNQLTYPRSWQALCRVFDQVRRDGNRAPQIAFLCPFGDPKKVVRELYDELYGANRYPELWFRWEGKPLILADPGMLGDTVRQAEQTTPARLLSDHTLGQSFTVDKALAAAGGRFPTWAAKGSSMTLSLYRGGPKGEPIASRTFESVADNAWVLLELEPALPPGTYYLEMARPSGTVGWWSCDRDVWAAGEAFADGVAVPGDRTAILRLDDPRDRQIRAFFTFRKPQPDYFAGPTGARQWGWLEVFPQHAFYRTPGVSEQVTVGVAQNAVDGKLSVLSNPRSHGRSFHDGAEPGPEGQDGSGRNFAEQWKRALEIDPPFIFVTGWNEWIAGRFDESSPFFGDGPVTFVDQFNQEYSRDVEPMKNGHGDNYYYQLVASVRRYKGVRALPPVTSHPIRIDGRFDDWTAAEPEFRDTIGDPVRRDHPGWGAAGRYTNTTGRNDIVAAKVSFDERNVYFYARTRETLPPPADPNWMLLFINADGNLSNGWLGYDLIVNRTAAGPETSVLERHTGSGYGWGSPVKIPLRAAGNELELLIPREALGVAKLPAVIDFKWADNIQQTGDWSDFTLNGDAAPNDRFNYRARLVQR